VEFHGEGASSLPVPDRATIGNMAPEYGATIGFFLLMKELVGTLQRPDEPSQGRCVRNYYTAEDVWDSSRDECQYSTVVELDLASVVPAVMVQSVLRIELT